MNAMFPNWVSKPCGCCGLPTLANDTGPGAIHFCNCGAGPLCVTCQGRRDRPCCAFRVPGSDRVQSTGEVSKD